MMIDSKFTSDLGQHYSREYVELYGLDEDLISFNFAVLFEAMAPGHIKYITCAGFGNQAIGKSSTGNPVLLYYIMNRQHAYTMDLISMIPFYSLLEDKDAYLFGPPMDVQSGYINKKEYIN